MSDDSRTPVIIEPPQTQPRSTSNVLGLIAALLGLALFIALVIWALTARGGLAHDAMRDVKSNRIQAVYMNNDRVFFGRLEARDGNWLRLNKAYYLKRDDSAAGTKNSSTTAKIVAASEEVGGDGNLLINADDVVLVQNLNPASPIAQHIKGAS